jgi:hypothetical protein
MKNSSKFLKGTPLDGKIMREKLLGKKEENLAKNTNQKF